MPANVMPTMHDVLQHGGIGTRIPSLEKCFRFLATRDLGCGSIEKRTWVALD